MTEYIDREEALWAMGAALGDMAEAADNVRDIPAADVQKVVRCIDCKHNGACLTQEFVEDASRIPFDRNAWFCADGKRVGDA